MTVVRNEANVESRKANNFSICVARINEIGKNNLFDTNGHSQIVICTEIDYTLRRIFDVDCGLLR